MVIILEASAAHKSLDALEPCRARCLGPTLLRSTRLAAAHSISCLRADLPPRSKFEGPGSSGEILRAVPR